MPKITFLGAGSSIFAKNVLGDCMCVESLHNSHIALYDIDRTRLTESARMMNTLNRNINKKRAVITTHLGVRNRKAALRNADYVVNAIQVGGYSPCTVMDFEIPKKYGLRQTIGDTVGIGGIFRGLRTIHVMRSISADIESVCPDAWLLNYTNPMSIITGAMLRGTRVKTVGLCHSVQVCASGLLKNLDMFDNVKNLRWKTAGINHMGWLLELFDGDKDLYPEIKRRAAKRNREARKNMNSSHKDMVRLEMMKHFGYYVTESSTHSAEYTPYWIKDKYPELIDEFRIGIDQYPKTCLRQIEKWKTLALEVVRNKNLKHTRTHEYGSYILDAIETNVPCGIGGNVINNNMITNLPDNAVVEIPCMVDRNGVQGCFVGALPEQCAALNRTHINVHLLVIEAALTLRKSAIYQAAYLDPHTGSELSLDRIKAMCDELLKAQADWHPKYK